MPRGNASSVPAPSIAPSGIHDREVTDDSIRNAGSFRFQAAFSPARGVHPKGLWSGQRGSGGAGGGGTPGGSGSTAQRAGVGGRPSRARTRPAVPGTNGQAATPRASSNGSGRGSSR